jgi:hypothetical protein
MWIITLLKMRTKYTPFIIKILKSKCKYYNIQNQHLNVIFQKKC